MINLVGARSACPLSNRSSKSPQNPRILLTSKASKKPGFVQMKIQVKYLPSSIVSIVIFITLVFLFKSNTINEPKQIIELANASPAAQVLESAKEKSHIMHTEVDSLSKNVIAELLASDTRSADLLKDADLKIKKLLQDCHDGNEMMITRDMSWENEPSRKVYVQKVCFFDNSTVLSY